MLHLLLGDYGPVPDLCVEGLEIGLSPQGETRDAADQIECVVDCIEGAMTGAADRLETRWLVGFDGSGDEVLHAVDFSTTGAELQGLTEWRYRESL